MSWIMWIPAVLAAVAVGMLLHLGLSGLVDLLRYGVGRRRRMLLSLEWLARRGETGAEQELISCT